MKPDVPLVLQHSFGKLLLEVAPNLTAEYAVGNTSVIGLMMFMSAAEFERGAQLRAEENAEMRAIFEETGGLGLPGDLQKRLGAAAGGREASLLISDLDAENDRLKTLLIWTASPRASLARASGGSCARPRKSANCLILLSDRHFKAPL